MMKNKLCRFMGRLAGRPLRLEEYAADAITLCGQEEQEVPPAVFLEEHLGRIERTSKLDDLADVLESIRRPRVVHAPSLLFPVGETRLFGGGLWTSSRRFHSRTIHGQERGGAVELRQAVLTDSEFGNRYFGHWIRDAVPASLVGTDEMPALALCRPPFAHAGEYARLFDLHILHASRGRVENLFLLSDYAQNSFKRRRYMFLRERLERHVRPEPVSSRGVFIARGGTGLSRVLLNEEEVIAHLERRGFDVIFPERMGAADIVRRLWGARVVVTVEGSQHNHALYAMDSGGALLTLQPPRRFGSIIKGPCDCLGIRWGFYVCAAAARGQGFQVDSLDRLDRLLDMLGCGG